MVIAASLKIHSLVPLGLEGERVRKNFPDGIVTMSCSEMSFGWNSRRTRNIAYKFVDALYFCGTWIVYRYPAPYDPLGQIQNSVAEKVAASVSIDLTNFPIEWARMWYK